MTQPNPTPLQPPRDHSRDPDGRESSIKVAIPAAAISALSGVRVDGLVAALATDGRATLDLDGEAVVLEAAMVEVVETPSTGWAVATDGTVSVALDTTLTPELELEGAARELVRAVNDRRKAQGLELTDRIALGLEVEPAELGERLTAAGLLEGVAREVLAVRVGAVSDDATEVDLGGLGTARFSVLRA